MEGDVLFLCCLPCLVEDDVSDGIARLICKIQSVKMGVFQITSAQSTNVSDSGIYDTSSIDKKVTAVANVVFKIK